MAGARALRGWTWLHKWTSLVCTAFMLLLCVTGLPLIFHHEIDHLLGDEVEPAQMAPDAPRVTIDRVMSAARALYPDRIVQFVSQPPDDDRQWSVTLTPTPAPTEDFKSITVDARTGDVLADVKFDSGIMFVLFKLHVDLFAGLAGKLFLGLMGLLLVVSIVSGVVLYAPFMRKLDFGTVRRDRSPRIRWLDLHNLLGIVTLVWLLVVGATGVINTWAELLVQYWQHDVLSALVAPYKDQPALRQEQRAPVQATFDAALASSPGTRIAFVALPGTSFSSPHHNTFYLRGATPLTSRLLLPVMVDAKTAKVTAAPAVPWYLTALLLSQPLHFGDYGGWPMKVLWCLLDVATIVVLASGVYLWFKRKSPRALIDEAQETMPADLRGVP